MGFLNAEIGFGNLDFSPDVFHTEVPSVYQTQQTSSHLLFPVSAFSYPQLSKSNGVLLRQPIQEPHFFSLEMLSHFSSYPPCSRCLVQVVGIERVILEPSSCQHQQSYLFLQLVSL